MLVVELTYLKPIEVIERHLKDHRLFLDTYYAQGVFLASGPQSPRDGGIIIALTDKASMEKLLMDDPFHKYGIASYRIIDFTPVKYCDALKPLILSD